ncbi:peptide/nickel transport system permease protein [Sphaerochaeta associata]|uniref:ABC transporter permease n=1 Tax=Sphaerochaeta associata TaxID=1129264 RepID=A0ABY4D8T6_9SPIR|nr:ABC transporter permease [Sphaerochaeta associata]UOM50702.1 ABC transporter permease [Sphaerochaeta associata]SMP39482.1 peptide/nickel transport system permease protein [Sphaerochaeta associata]
MIRYIIKRILWMIPVILGVAIFIFSLMYFVPGDPAAIILGSDATELELNLLREKLGFNEPFLTRLVEYLANVFLRFDFGESYITHNSITTELVRRMPYTFTLAVLCMLISVAGGVPLGVNAAVHQNKWGDRISMLIALAGVSIPAFWLGLMLVLLFSLKLGWLPAYGIGGIQYFILPAIANSLGQLAMLARQSRSSMLEVIRSDYIVTAHAKGQTKNKVIYKHALPNALIPIVTVAGSNFGRSLGGTVIIENVFSMPGIGSYMVTAINQRDYLVVQGSVILLAVSFCFIILLVDILYAFIDPRIKAQYEGVARRKKHV